MRPFFVFLGPPGSGKGTQGRLLASYFGLPYLATGDVVREAIKNKARDAWHKAIRARYTAGTPQPDPVMNRLLAEKLKQVDMKNGIIFDAYPLSLGQIKGFERLLEKYQAVPRVFILKVSQNEVVRRMGQRKFCSHCNLSYLPDCLSARHNQCKVCKGTLATRQDDKKETVVKRYREYKRRLKPMSSYFKKQKWLCEINGEQPVAKIQREIRRETRRT